MFKRLKKIIPLALILALLVPYQAFAAHEAGVLRGVENSVGRTSLTDGDHNTTQVVGTGGTLTNDILATDLGSFAIYGVNVGHLEIRYFNAVGEEVYFKQLYSSNSNTVITHPTIFDVTKVTIKNTSSTYTNTLNEFDVYVGEQDTTAPAEVTNLKQTTSSGGNLGVEWLNPTDSDFAEVNVYVNGAFALSTVGNTYHLSTLTYGGVIKVTTVDTAGNESAGTSFTLTEPDTDGDGIADSTDTYPNDPTNTPPDADADGVPDSEDAFPNDPAETTDTDGDGIGDNADEYPNDPTNTPVPYDVTDLQIEATHDQATLAWTLPGSNLDKVIIYRRAIPETATNWNPLAPMTVHASETTGSTEYEKIGETTESSYTDTTIEPGTEYEYKVTSSFEGVESTGVVAATIVPAVPLVDLSDMKLPFGLGDVLHANNSLLALVSGFVVLAIAFLFAPRIIKLIFRANHSGKANTKEIQRAYRISREARIEKEARAPKEPREGRQSSRLPRELRKGGT